MALEGLERQEVTSEWRLTISHDAYYRKHVAPTQKAFKFDQYTEYVDKFKHLAGNLSMSVHHVPGHET